MTVADLIDYLRQFPPEAEVAVVDAQYEGALELTALDYGRRVGLVCPEVHRQAMRQLTESAP